MKLSRAKAFTSIIFIAFCLLFSYQFLIFAQQPETNIPAELQELLQGKSSDFSSAASQLKETDLPAALAVVELLKFKALHREIPASIDQINNFESQIKSRLEKSSGVSLSKTDTCRKKIEATEIEIAGQKIAIPEYYISEAGLAITGVIPTGEAGTVFPDIQINFISQSPIKEYSLVIDGDAVQQNKISTFKDGDEFGLIFRPDLNADSILSIGTHTAEITISNEKGETANKKWSFTVGVYNTSEPPIPEGAAIVTELPISPKHILPGSKTDGELIIIVYQDKAGKRYTSYKMVTPSGMTIQSRNLAFIAREIGSDKKGTTYVHILPRLTFAFVGNQITFSYEYEFSTPGTIVKETWSINSGGQASSNPSVTILGYTTVKCELEVEHSYRDNTGQTKTFRTTYSDYRDINEFKIKANIYDGTYNRNREFFIGDGTHEFSLSGRVSIENTVWGSLAEGGEYKDSNGVGGVLIADKLRWSFLNSEGSPKIKNPVASQTTVLFTKPGFAEISFDVALTWQQDGQTLKSSFKPNISGLYAFYPATGNVDFKTFHPAQLSSTYRLLEIKNYSVEIKGQKRTVESDSDWKFAQPIALCQSVIDPASYPLQVVNAWPALLSSPTSGYPNGRPLTQKSIFSYLTLSVSAGEMPLRFFCEFHPYGGFLDTNSLSFVKDLPSISVYNSVDVMETVLHPSEVSSIQEGQQQIFSAEVIPKDNFGVGSLSSSTKDINVLNGYKYNRLKYIRWIDRPLFQSDIGEIVEEGSNYDHILNTKAGIGSYSLDCNAYLFLEDSETKKNWGRYVPSSNPIEVTPGLRILSPIDKLAYPLNRTIKVTTTMDTENRDQQWDKIKWKLNGKEFVPDTDKPPFFIHLDHVGNWKIEAVLETKNQNGSDIVFKDSAEFEVKPIEISITPAKRVLAVKTEKKCEIKASVFANETEIQKPGEAVAWQDNSTKIVIDSISWNLVTEPDKCAAITPVPQTFKANCEFENAGAVTALATVTVRIIGAKKLFDKKHKGFNDKFEEQIFEIPAGRADLWALEPAIWKELYSDLSDKLFPKQAVSPAGRTFTIKDGLVKFDGKEYPWSTETGFDEQISMPAALQDDTSPSATCSKIEFEWSCADNSPSNSITFVPTFKKSGSAVVKLKSSLIFDGNNSIPFIEKEFLVSVQDIETLVRYYINPHDFQMSLAQTKRFDFSFEPIESYPVPTVSKAGSEFYILNGVYKISLEEIEWHYEVASTTSSIISADSFIFSPLEIGNYKISGTAKCWIIEFPFSPNKIKWPWSPESASFGSVTGLNVQIFGNNESLESGEYHLGQEIELSYTISNLPEDIVIEKQQWVISSPTPRSFFISDDLNKGHVETVPEAEFKKPAVKFFLYDFFLTHEEEVDFGRKTGTLVLTYAGKEFPYPFFIPYKKPYLKNVKVEKREQNVKVVLDQGDSTWKIGFHDTDKIGIQAHAEVFNPTNQRYTITATHLIKRNDKHSFFSTSSTPEIYKQFKKTIPINLPESEPPEFWLDTYYPTSDAPVTAELPPHANLPEAILCDDIPLYKIYFEEPRVPISYETNTDFIVYFWAIPEPFDKSAWCPIKRMVWHWSGNTSYDPQKAEWVDNQDNYSVQDIEFTPVDFPNWSGWAHPTLTFENGMVIPEQPVWRDLK